MTNLSPGHSRLPFLLFTLAGLALPVMAQDATVGGAEAGATQAGSGTVQDSAADTDVEAAVNEPKRWTLRFEPGVWFVAPGGDIKMPQLGGGGGGDELGVASIGPGDRDFTKLNDLELDRPEASPAGEIHLGFGDWRFCLRGFSSSTDADATATGGGSINGLSFVEGDEIESSLDFLAAEAEVGYSLYRNTPRQSGTGRDVLRTNLEAVAGVRLYDVDWEIGNTSSGAESLEAQESFFEPLIGGRFAMEFYEEFDLDFQLTVGGLPLGDDSSFSVDVLAGFTWRPFENFGVQIGYRQLLFDLQSGEDTQEFEYDGALAGLYGGVLFQF